MFQIFVIFVDFTHQHMITIIVVHKYKFTESCFLLLVCIFDKNVPSYFLLIQKPRYNTSISDLSISDLDKAKENQYNFH